MPKPNHRISVLLAVESISARLAAVLVRCLVLALLIAFFNEVKVAEEKHDGVRRPFVTVCAPLQVGNASAAIIVLEDGRYLMQHRDDMPQIWYPGHWGCFGGSVDACEGPVEALKRELHEELELTPSTATYFTRFDFDLSGTGIGRYYRNYYIVPVSNAEWQRMVLHEGQGMQAFSGEKILSELRVTPYDAFALFLYHNRLTLSGSGESAVL